MRNELIPPLLGYYTMAGGGSSTIFYDTFTAADATTNNGRTPDISAISKTWADVDGSSTIYDNMWTGGNNPTLAKIDCGTANIKITLTANCLKSNFIPRISGVMFRVTDASNYWVAGLHYSGLVIMEMNASTATIRATESFTITNYAYYTLVATAIGQTISCTVNGTTVSYASAALNEAVTYHGIYEYYNRSVGVYADNFLAESL